MSCHRYHACQHYQFLTPKLPNYSKQTGLSRADSPIPEVSCLATLTLLLHRYKRKSQMQRDLAGMTTTTTITTDQCISQFAIVPRLLGSQVAMQNQPPQIVIGYFSAVVLVHPFSFFPSSAGPYPRP